jgi:hypothetical protein
MSAKQLLLATRRAETLAPLEKHFEKVKPPSPDNLKQSNGCPPLKFICFYESTFKIRQF